MNNSDNYRIKKVKYNRIIKDALEQIPKGAFLTVKAGDKINTMTIGWATFGVMWGRPVLTIGVRPSRFTYGFIDQDTEFTVSVPVNQQLKKQLGYCGTHSGKNEDKFDNCEISLRDGETVDVPVVKECGLHFECKVVAKHQLIPDYIDETILGRYYPEEDFHMMFYGEILDAYKVMES